jgi:RNase P subunit RPR2
MLCQKCNGLVVIERTPHTRDEDTSYDPIQERCLNCGRISSRLIRKNLAKPPVVGSVLLDMELTPELVEV